MQAAAQCWLPFYMSGKLGMILEGFTLRVTQKDEMEYELNITHWFQPIYNLENNDVIGYEALLRDSSRLQVSPVDLFDKAGKCGHRNTLDLISLKTALEFFPLESTNQLFLNIFPSTLLQEGFLSWWDLNVPRSVQVVLELLESEPITDWKEVKRITGELRDRGIKIAIDDMGGGYSFFQQWIELDPDYIKLDRYFSENLSFNCRKQKTIRCLVELIADTSEIILEGIETVEDLGFAQLLGVTRAQGYLLGRPSPLDNIV
jgi:EAL domain-containing protein (putative c-di-GMP-specific phosphodiesterase class I)